MACSGRPFPLRGDNSFWMRRKHFDGREHRCRHRCGENTLTAENIDAVIDAVNHLHDASTTGYLLELKRIRFGHSHNDYAL